MSARFIILFGLLALSVVLLNAIAITINQHNDGDVVAQRYCGQSHQRYPLDCTIDGVFDCSDHYVMRSTCFGVGDIIVDQHGTFIDWCGYAVFGGSQSGSCDRYEIDPQGNRCAIANNLCNPS